MRECEPASFHTTSLRLMCVPFPIPLIMLAPGYGNTGPQNCATAAVLITIQTVSDLLLNAVILGLIFAKVPATECNLCTGEGWELG